MGLSKIFKRVLTAGLALAMAVAAAGCGGGNANESFVNIATGGTAGTYYPIGGAIADVLNKNAKDVNASAQSTGASVANINMLKDKQVEMAIVQNDITYYAVNGTEMFENKIENLRGIASLYPETCQFVTLESSGIKTIADLKGKRVAVGAAGSGVEGNVRQILKAYGLTYDDIDEQFLSFAEGAAALKDGTVDVACLTAGAPTASVQDVASQKQIRLIPLEDEKIAELVKDYPFYTKTTVPGGTYQGFNEDIQTVSVMAILVATDKMTDETGYEITKAIFGNLDKISAAHSVAKSIAKDKALDGMDFIKMNGGAEKFLKE
ncbi:MAG: TAXI family TRAP transporter solute-binding subunit [Selenomonadaceae bacterium]|nr:TAXI family TRAP transporter solute-binding subunit [Selenomonadaceae bacterium]